MQAGLHLAPLIYAHITALPLISDVPNSLQAPAGRGCATTPATTGSLVAVEKKALSIVVNPHSCEQITPTKSSRRYIAYLALQHTFHYDLSRR